MEKFEQTETDLGQATMTKRKEYCPSQIKMFEANPSTSVLLP